jgi:hypothetical protein
VLVEEHGEPLGWAVVGDEARDDGGLGVGEGFEAALDLFEEVGTVRIVFMAGDGGVLGSDEGLLRGVLLAAASASNWWRGAVMLWKMALLRWPGGRATMVKRLRGSIQSPQGLRTIGPATDAERTARASMAVRSTGVWVARDSERT